MVDPVRNKQHGNGDRNDNQVAEGDRRRHEENKQRLEKEDKDRKPKATPSRR